MNIANETLSGGAAFKRAGVKETAVLLAVAWLVPFLVHTLPWSGSLPLGAHLLPIFWATFVAVYFYGLRVGLLVGVLTPAINLLVTGLPNLQRQSMMAVELVAFVAVAWLMVRRRPKMWLIAPLSYVAVRIAVLVIQSVAAPGGNLAVMIYGSLVTGLAGLAALTVINFALVRLFPKSRDSADDAAGV